MMIHIHNNKLNVRPQQVRQRREDREKELEEMDRLKAEEVCMHVYVCACVCV